ncbi:tetratricopeptide repeat protein [Pedobacter cryoconitis]|uniref:Tetratricopeptide (TPR) repeat protein n=1 Tax=Pedobacter cryoconitis TaxID=188932 RepID=A0A7X0J4K7_9SPHI|nr:hypothetical protein [Pedobacter cryoconitis]MBB6500950.1 tetratricopeptide (TPR) repeat protein [Pedobacter cryoconitis]
MDSLITAIINANTTTKKIQIEHEVYDLSKAAGYRDGLIEGRINLIAGLNALGNQDKALKLIDESINEAIQFNDSSYIIQLLKLKASCYSMLGFFDESKAALTQAMSYALKLNDNNLYRSALGSIDEMMAWNIETAKGNPDSILFYLKNGSQQYAKLTVERKNNIYFFNILNRIGMKYFEKNQYDSARKYLPYIYQIKEEYRKSNSSGIFSTYFTDARLKYISKDYQKSLIAYQNALGVSQNYPYYQKYVYKDLAQVYGKLNNQKKEAFFLNKYAVLNDSINRAEKLQIRQPLERIIKAKNTAKNKDKASYILLIAAPASLLIGVVIFYSYRKRIREEQQIATPGEDQTELASNQNEDTLIELIELAKRNSPILYTRFNELDPTFCKRLLTIAPGLLITEQELCIYIRLNFDTKEIARYTMSSIKAVQAKKYRIRKKLNISTETDIMNWIINF